MIFLLGRHAMFGHEPPMYFRSIEAVRLPSRANVQAISFPPVPLPNTRTSYFSGSLLAMIASLERVGSRIPARDELSIGPMGFGVAVPIGFSKPSGDADRPFPPPLFR